MTCQVDSKTHFWNRALALYLEVICHSAGFENMDKIIALYWGGYDVGTQFERYETFYHINAFYEYNPCREHQEPHLLQTIS